MGDIGIYVLVVTVIGIISYANKMRKSWDQDTSELGPTTASYESDESNEFPYRYRPEPIIDQNELDNLETMPIVDEVSDYKFTQYTPPVFTLTTGSFDAVSSEDDLISSFSYDEQEKAAHTNIITDFDLKKAVIYSEILKPKWNS